jgi:Domain of unknown function (DUF4373)
MSRPIKQGLDYFPMDVDLDNKFELIEAKHGVAGFGIIIKLFQRIYKEGYFLKWDEETALLFSKKINVDINEVNAIIEDCFRYQLFSKTTFSRYKILTSAGIQKRFCSAIKRRNEVNFCKNFILIDVNALINVDINWINVNNKYTKESKEKKSKGEHFKKIGTFSEKVNFSFKTFLQEQKEPVSEERKIALAEHLENLAPNDEEMQIAIISQAIAGNYPDFRPLPAEKIQGGGNSNRIEHEPPSRKGNDLDDRKPPAIDEVIKYFADNGQTEELARKAFEVYSHFKWIGKDNVSRIPDWMDSMKKTYFTANG